MTVEHVEFADLSQGSKLVWIADGDASIRLALERALSQVGMTVQGFGSGDEVLSALNDKSPGVLVADVDRPGDSGFDLLGKIKKLDPGLPVIIMTAHSNLASAVLSFQGGAFDYLPKPFDVPSAVELIRRALAESSRMTVLDAAILPAPEILGQAPSMQGVFRAIGRLSQSTVAVLITGETGAGKEMVARALHRHSPRGSHGSNGAFVAINTAAIPKDLLESELFGHERGAFTGAQTMRRGRFEQADGGTLFLDEIGDMPFELQTRLLRVLSEGYFHRVGGQHQIKSNVRIVAATHQDLEERVRQGAFREDLFHRLNVIRLRLPPLRERQEDIPALARFFLQKSARELGIEAKQITLDALEAMKKFDFPGNVRELENICQWLTVMAPARVIERRDLPPELIPVQVDGEIERSAESSRVDSRDRTPLARGALRRPAATIAHPSLLRSAEVAASTDWLGDLETSARALLEAGSPDVWNQLSRQFEGQLIRAALAVTRGRRIEAAQKLGVGRNTISRKILDLGLET